MRRIKPIISVCTGCGTAALNRDLDWVRLGPGDAPMFWCCSSCRKHGMAVMQDDRGHYVQFLHPTPKQR